VPCGTLVFKTSALDQLCDSSVLHCLEQLSNLLFFRRLADPPDGGQD